MTDLYIEYGPVVLAAIFTGLAWLYSRFLADKIKGQRWGQMALRAGQELRAVITEVNATYVKELKAAGEDGTWTDKEKAKAKEMAIAKFKENWGAAGVKRMAKVLGIGDAVDSWLGTQVEATLAEMKALPPKQ